MRYLKTVKERILSVLLVLVLSIILIGSTFTNVDASAGDNNKTLVIENLFYENVLDDSNIDSGDILYGSGYSYDFDTDYIEGKNLYPYDLQYLEDNDDGEIGVNYNSITLNVLPDTNYTFNCNMLGASSASTYIYIKGQTDDFTLLTSTGIKEVNVKSNLNGTITIGFHINLWLNSELALVDDIQLELGSTATTYEVYEPRDDLYTERFDRDFNDVLQSSTGWSTGNPLTNTHEFRKDLSVLGYAYQSVASLAPNYILKINDILYNSASADVMYIDDVELNFGSSAGASQLRIRVNKITYPNTASFEVLLNTGDVDFIYELDTYIERTVPYTYLDYISIDELPYLYNLTELFGSENEPTLSEFEVILADAPDYFDEWNYNYYEADSSIVEFDCQRTANNLIDNGDFSDTSIWTNQSSSTWIISDGVVEYQDLGTSYLGQPLIIDIDNIYYLEYEVIDFGIGTKLAFVSEIGGNLFNNLDDTSFVYDDNEHFSNDVFSYLIKGIYNSTGVRMYGSTTYSKYSLDNIMLFDLTEMYGQGNEPSLEEWEVILNANLVDGYTDGFTYDDTCYMTVEQNNPLYMYYDFIELVAPSLEISMTDTIKDLPLTYPKISIEKYDLNMTYLGNIYEGYIIDNSLTDGYYTHTYSYILPEPTTSEDGYIYVAYDTKDNNILASGYIFSEPSLSFLTENDTYNAIGVNGSVYNTLSETYLFEGDYENYMFNDSNYLITHFRAGTDNMDSDYIYYYSENTDQIVTIAIEDVYNDFCNMGFEYPANPPTNTYECYFYASSGDFLPPLFNFLQSSAIAHNSYLTGVLSTYVSDYTNFFYNELYADNKGVYTYNMVVEASVYLGETPIYHFGAFHDLELASHSVKEGGVLRANITKPESYLDEVYEYQYLYDNNTAVYYFDITSDLEQEVYLETFLGLTPDNATVSYYLKALESYRNEAPLDAYDVSDSDVYVMREIVPFTDKVDNGLDMLGLNDAFGKIVFSGLLLIFSTILVFILSKKNVIATLIIDFLVISLLVVLGIIPTWIMLFILVLILGTFYLVIKRKGD